MNGGRACRLSRTEGEIVKQIACCAKSGERPRCNGWVAIFLKRTHPATKFIQVMPTTNDVYDNPLIGRYASSAMSERWGPLRKFSTWRKLWLRSPKHRRN